jgi:hypothetical protein
VSVGPEEEEEAGEAAKLSPPDQHEDSVRLGRPGGFSRRRKQGETEIIDSLFLFQLIFKCFSSSIKLF